MSGPIIRKYGFPNFEKIFGERELKHGAEGDSTSTPPPATPAESAKPTSESQPSKDNAKHPKL